MQTTITISDQTRRRLSDYKRGDATYDDVLNNLMDLVPIEDVAMKDIEEHYKRLQTFQAIPANKIRERILKRLQRAK